MICHLWTTQLHELVHKFDRRFNCRRYWSAGSAGAVLVDQAVPQNVVHRWRDTEELQEDKPPGPVLSTPAMMTYAAARELEEFRNGLQVRDGHPPVIACWYCFNLFLLKRTLLCIC